MSYGGFYIKATDMVSDDGGFIEDSVCSWVCACWHQLFHEWQVRAGAAAGHKLLEEATAKSFTCLEAS